MGEVVFYKVLINGNDNEHAAIQRLEEEVNKWTDGGWKPMGGVSLAWETSKNRWVASQAMVIERDESLMPKKDI